MKGVYTEKKKKVYGVFGMGSTRLVIALANYYCSYLKKKVAVGELGMGGMTDISTNPDRGKKPKSFVNNGLVGFTKMKVDYYPGLSNKEAVQLIEENVDIIILDIKEISHECMNLLRLCTKRVFLSNIAVYNRRSFCRKRNILEKGMVEVEIYSYALNKADKAWYENVYKNSRNSNTVRDASLIRDPDRLTKEDISFLKKVGC